MAAKPSALDASSDTLLKYALALGDLWNVYILSPDAMAALGQDLAVVQRVRATDRSRYEMVILRHADDFLTAAFAVTARAFPSCDANVFAKFLPHAARSVRSWSAVNPVSACSTLSTMSDKRQKS